MLGRERWSILGSVKGLQCRECGQLYEAQPIHVCEMCFGPLEVAYDYDVIGNLISREEIARRAGAVPAAPAAKPVETPTAIP